MSEVNKDDITVGEALEKIGQGDREALALLRGIESNTKGALMDKAVENARPNKEVRNARAIVVPAPVVNVTVEAPPAPNVNNALAITPPRDSSGRFASSASTKPTESVKPAVSQLGAQPAETPADNKTLAQILKSGVAGGWQEKKGTVADIAGRAALGPLWDVGKQVKESIQSAKERSGEGTAGELKQWAAGKMGKSAPDTKSAAGITKSNQELQDAIEDLTGAVKKNTGGKNQKIKQGFQRFPQSRDQNRKTNLKDVIQRRPDNRFSIRPTRNAGGGGSGGGGGGGLMDLLGKGGGVMSGIVGMIGPAIAVAVAGAAGAAIGTGSHTWLAPCFVRATAIPARCKRLHDHDLKLFDSC